MYCAHVIISFLRRARYELRRRSHGTRLVDGNATIDWALDGKKKPERLTSNSAGLERPVELLKNNKKSCCREVDVEHTDVLAFAVENAKHTGTMYYVFASVGEQKRSHKSIDFGRFLVRCWPNGPLIRSTSFVRWHA